MFNLFLMPNFYKKTWIKINSLFQFWSLDNKSINHRKVLFFFLYQGYEESVIMAQELVTFCWHQQWVKVINGKLSESRELIDRWYWTHFLNISINNVLEKISVTSEIHQFQLTHFFSIIETFSDCKRLVIKTKYWIHAGKDEIASI